VEKNNRRQVSTISGQSVYDFGKKDLRFQKTRSLNPKKSRLRRAKSDIFPLVQPPKFSRLRRAKSNPFPLV